MCEDVFAMRPASISGATGSLLVSVTTVLYLVIINSQGNVDTRRVAVWAVTLGTCASVTRDCWVVVSPTEGSEHHLGDHCRRAPRVGFPRNFLDWAAPGCSGRSSDGRHSEGGRRRPFGFHVASVSSGCDRACWKPDSAALDHLALAAAEGSDTRPTSPGPRCSRPRNLAGAQASMSAPAKSSSTAS